MSKQNEKTCITFSRIDDQKNNCINIYYEKNFKNIKFYMTQNSLKIATRL